MLIKGIKKHGRTVDFKIGFSVAVLSILVVIATLLICTLFKGIISAKIGIPAFAGIIILHWVIGSLKE